MRNAQAQKTQSDLQSFRQKLQDHANKTAFDLLVTQKQIADLTTEAEKLKTALKTYAQGRGMNFPFEGYGTVQVTRQTEKEPTGQTAPQIDMSKLDSLSPATRQRLISKGVLKYLPTYTGGAAPSVRVTLNK